MSEWRTQPGFTGWKNIGTGDGVRIRLRETPIVSVLARRGQRETLAARFADAPRQTVAADITALGIGPGRWLLMGRKEEELGDLSEFASLSDHSDGYALFDVWGKNLRDVLAKGVPVDLHPHVFTDDVAVTVIAHIGAIIWQSAPDRFTIAVFRSYTGSFWHWLSASAAQFGLLVEH